LPVRRDRYCFLNPRELLLGDSFEVSSILKAIDLKGSLNYFKTAALGKTNEKFGAKMS